MDTRKQLKALWDDTKMCFKSPASIVVFCIIGWMFWLGYMFVLVPTIFSIMALQVVTREFDVAVNLKKHPAIVCMILFFTGAFLAFIKYGWLPWLYLFYWLMLNIGLYYPVIWLITLGKARWTGIIYTTYDDEDEKVT